MGPVGNLEAPRGGWKEVLLGAGLSGVAGALGGAALAAFFYRPGELGSCIGVAAMQGGIGAASGAGLSVIASREFGETRVRKICRGLTGAVGYATLVVTICEVGRKRFPGQMPFWQLNAIGAATALLTFFPSAFLKGEVGNGFAGIGASVGVGAFISLALGEFAQKIVPQVGKHVYSYAVAGFLAFPGFIVGYDYFKTMRG